MYLVPEGVSTTTTHLPLTSTLFALPIMTLEKYYQSSSLKKTVF